MLLLFYALSFFEGTARKLVVSYLAMWCFSAMLLLTGLETRIQNNNLWYVPDHKSQHMHDLLTFNYNTSFEGPYPLSKMELMHWVYDELLTGEMTEKEVPVVSSQEETYLYESVTGQRLADYRFWLTEEFDGLTVYFENLDSRVDYVCVFTDSDLYSFQQEYFDHFTRVYENSAGYIARVEPGVFDELKAK